MRRKKAITLALLVVITFSILSVLSATVTAPTTYEYLIVTTAPLSDEFQVLADWKAKWVNGARVETVSANVTDVGVKSVIDDYYTNYNTKYVLLGGDVSVIPCHIVKPLPNSSFTIAEDYWFANLDGDEEISEYEVYVGRAPVDDDTETMNFVKKVISFEQMNKPKANLFHQSRIKPNNDPDSRELAWQCENFTPPSYTDYELFEENGTIEKADWINFWNNDAIMFEHIGHGFSEVNETLGDPDPGTYTINYEVGGEVKWNVTDVHSLNNTFWPVHTSVACTIGDFTHEDSLAEAYVKEPDHGAIAVLANSHLGWFRRDDATRFSGDFIEMQFKVLYEEGYENIGAMLARSKHYFIDEATNSSDPAQWVWDWCWREINLIGDPETPVLTQRHSPPVTPSPPSGPATGYVYTDIEFYASTTDPEGDDVLYEFSWGDNTTTIVDPYPSGENATASHRWKWPKIYEVKVRAKDVYGDWTPIWSNNTLITLSQNDAGTGQDAGDSYDSATSIAPSSYKGTLYYSNPPDTDDYYKFSVESGQTIAVSMTPPEGVNFDLELYSPSDPYNPATGSYNGNGTTDSVTIYQAESGGWRARIFQDYREGQCSFIVSVYTPGGGCPFVYAWNGTDYVIDNNLLAWSAWSNGTEVEDYYKLEQSLAPIHKGNLYSLYSLKLSEFQQEHSYLDQIRFMTVDHDSEISVAISPFGEILTYQHPYTPMSAVDEQGQNQIDLIRDIDDSYYEGYDGSYLLLNFGHVAAENAKLVMRADRPPSKQSIHIQVLNSSENWVDVASIIPRTYWATEIIDLTSYLPTVGDFRVRLYFTDNHKLDFVGLDTTTQAQINVEEAQLLLAYHSDDGFVTAKLLNDDDVYAELIPEQQIVLVFVATSRSEEQRTFIIYVKGYYITIGN